jgi:hypothetical protein
LNSGGNGTIAALSTEYDVSLARILWYPAGYDGRSPDLRVALGGIYHWTVETEDPLFEGADGFLAAARFEYRMLPWLSGILRGDVESRDWIRGRYGVYRLSPGVEFRTDWQSPERIFLGYSRIFYSEAVDLNPAQPLDQNTLLFEATLGF